MSGTGTVTFQGGGVYGMENVYVIRDGELSITGTLNVVGNGAAFYMTGSGARLDFGGTADMQMVAPQDGPLKGYIFFGDHDNASTAPHRLRGTAMGGYKGAIYLPYAILDFHGTADGTIPGGSDCTIAVADKFIFAGTPTFHAEGTCADYPELTGSGNVALVN